MDHVTVNEAYRVWHGASHLPGATLSQWGFFVNTDATKINGFIIQQNIFAPDFNGPESDQVSNYILEIGRLYGRRCFE